MLPTWSHAHSLSWYLILQDFYTIDYDENYCILKKIESQTWTFDKGWRDYYLTTRFFVLGINKWR